MATKIVTDFETWIKQNYSGTIMHDPPENWNPEKEMYYRIDDLHYGPIKWEDIPKEFMED